MAKKVAKKRKKPQKNYRGEMETEGELGSRSEKRRQDSVGSVGTDHGYLDNMKEAERQAQGVDVY